MALHPIASLKPHSLLFLQNSFPFLPRYQYLMSSLSSHSLRILAFGSILIFTSLSCDILRTLYSCRWLILHLKFSSTFPFPRTAQSSHFPHLFLHPAIATLPSPLPEFIRTKVCTISEILAKSNSLFFFLPLSFYHFSSFSLEFLEPQFVNLIETPSPLTDPFSLSIKPLLLLPSLLSGLNSMGDYYDNSFDNT